MDKIMEKQVKDFMTKDVISVSEDETLKKVFKIMDKHGILGVPVTSEDKGVIGIVTETDLMGHFTTLETPMGVSLLGSMVFLENPEQFNENLKDHCAELVKDIMTKEVITIMEDKSLNEAINLMASSKVSRLPVVNVKGELSGIITRTDIVHQLAKLTTI